jgi:hypothetical protein
VILREDTLRPSFFRTTSSYDDFKNINPKRANGTCEWFLRHDNFRNWKESDRDDLLWLSAHPGCGKSVLSRMLVDERLVGCASVCHFFFKESAKQNEQNKATTAICALLNQLFHQRQKLLERHVTSAFEKCGQALKTDFEQLWQILVSAATDEDAGNVVCILDALDECEPSDRNKLIARMQEFYISTRRQSGRKSCLKFFVNSRPYHDIEREFRDLTTDFPTIRLDGELGAEAISGEIQIVMESRLAIIKRKRRWSDNVVAALQERLSPVVNRTYLWLHLILEAIEFALGSTQSRLLPVIATMPETVDEAYDKILLRSKHKKAAKGLLSIIVAAQRPLTLGEIDVALGISEFFENSSTLSSYAEISLEKDGIRDWISQACGPFVTIVQGRVYLIHETAKAFLLRNPPSVAESGEWKNSILLTEAHKKLSQICIANLSLQEVKKLRPNSTKKEETSLQHLSTKYEFLEYSAISWLPHLRQSRMHRKSNHVYVHDLQAVDLCDLGDAKSSIWFEILSRNDPKYGQLRWTSGHQPTVFWTVSFGLIDETSYAFKKAMERSAMAYTMTYTLEAAVRNVTNGEELLRILIHSADSKIRMPAGLMQLTAGNAKQAEGLTKLLFEHRDHQISITPGVVEAAARNSGQGVEMIILLLDRRGSEISITPEVVKAAVCNSGQGVEMMTLLLDRCGSEISITPKVVEAAALNPKQGVEMMTLLLDRRGDEVSITPKIVEEAIRCTQRGGNLIHVLYTTGRSRIAITQEMVELAARSYVSTLELMTLLLEHRGHQISITPGVVEAAARNSGQGVEMMTLLLDRCGNQVSITPEVVEAAALNSEQGFEMMTLLLDRCGNQVSITPEVVEAVARNSEQGVEVMILLSQKRGPQVRITPKVVRTAIDNLRRGIEMTQLLLDLHGAQIDVECTVLTAALRNSCHGVQIMQLLFERCELKDKIGPQELEAAIRNSNQGLQLMLLLCDKLGDKFKVTPQMLGAAARNENQGVKLMQLMFDRCREKIEVTPQMLEAAARNEKQGVKLMQLMFDRCREKIEVTPQMLGAAACNEKQGAELMQLMFDRCRNNIEVTSEMLKTAALNDNHCVQWTEFLLSRRGSQTAITEQLLIAALHQSKQPVQLIRLLAKRSKDDSNFRFLQGYERFSETMGRFRLSTKSEKVYLHFNKYT